LGSSKIKAAAEKPTPRLRRHSTSMGHPLFLAMRGCTNPETLFDWIRPHVMSFAVSPGSYAIGLTYSPTPPRRPTHAPPPRPLSGEDGALDWRDSRRTEEVARDSRRTQVHRGDHRIGASSTRGPNATSFRVARVLRIPPKKSWRSMPSQYESRKVPLKRVSVSKCPRYSD